MKTLITCVPNRKLYKWIREYAADNVKVLEHYSELHRHEILRSIRQASYDYLRKHQKEVSRAISWERKRNVSRADIVLPPWLSVSGNMGKMPFPLYEAICRLASEPASPASRRMTPKGPITKITSFQRAYLEKNLPSRCFHVVLLRYAGFKNSQISKMLDVSPAAVSQHWSRYKKLNK